MRRNISANIVSIGSMRIAEVREEDKVVLVVMVVEQEDDVEVEWLSSGPLHLSEDDGDHAGRIVSFCDSS